MQPYFLPYLGYWQLMSCVDKFVIYDDIQFTKKGWIHRNRFLKDGRDQLFTLPLKNDSDYLDVVERKISDIWPKEREALRRRLVSAYKKAPHFYEVMDLANSILDEPCTSLFEFVYQSIVKVKLGLGIGTELLISSRISDTRDLKGQNRVIEICKHLNSSVYVNPIGGIELYNKDEFRCVGISLKFHRIFNVSYPQFNNDFIPNLSILDVLMFNGFEETKSLLTKFELV
ncbi:MAG: WbqC family protein [Pseudohongiella sp.]|nr:WbqC family protein [Pseudohongiella sp.]